MQSHSRNAGLAAVLFVPFLLVPGLALLWSKKWKPALLFVSVIALTLYYAVSALSPHVGLLLVAISISLHLLSLSILLLVKWR